MKQTVEQLYEAAISKIQNETDEAIKLLKDVAAKALAVEYEKIAAMSYLKLAECYRKLSNQPEELDNLLLCLNYFKTHPYPAEYYLCNISLGRIYANMGKYVEALDVILKSLEIAEAEKNLMWMVRSQNNLGLLYGRLFDFDRSIKHYLVAHQLLRNNANEDTLQSMKTNCFLGNTYTRMRLFDRAYDHFSLAYTELKPHYNSYDFLMPLRGLAYLYLEQKQPEKAKTFIDKAREHLKEKHDVFSFVNIYLLEAEYEQQQKNYTRAIELLNQGLCLVEKHEVVILKKQLLSALSVAYELAGNFEFSLKYLKAFYELKEKSMSEETSLNILHLETQYKVHETEKARQIAEETSVIKENLLMNLSHEINTPLNSISGFTQLLFQTPMNAEQLDYLKAINKSIDTLLEIIYDILELTKINSGNSMAEFDDFSLKTLLAEIFTTMKFKSEANNVGLKMELDKHLPEWMNGDVKHLKQIFINLIGNAIKFSKNTDIIISADLKTPIAEKFKISFSVSDKGIGIAEEHLANIFESFNKASTLTNKEFGGTGLGLSICKKLTDLMNGTISVTSELGKGTTFNFQIPFYKAKTHATVLPALTKFKDIENLKPIRILVIEDNAFNQKLVEKAINLTLKNAYVDLAENGAVGIQLFEKNDYDIILMDIQMPVMNGFEAADYIRKEMPNPKNQIPILALSANVIKSEVEKCFEHGMNDYIAKPFNIPELVKKIVTICKMQ